MRHKAVFVALSVAFVCARPGDASAQRAAVTVRVRVESRGRVLSGALVRAGGAAGQSNAAGTATLSLASRYAVITASYLGFRSDSIAVDLRNGTDTTVTIELHELTAQGAPIIVSRTGVPRHSSDDPVLLVVIDSAQIERASQLAPGSAVALFSETPTVRVQTTGSGLGGVAIRLLGLPGQYTQLLVDGLPLFGFTRRGLEPLQLSPVAVRQVEIVEGAGAALYGPTALGGIVDFISRRPETKTELLLGQTIRDGSDAVLWNSRELSPTFGYTLLMGGYRQREQFIGSGEWADIPGYERGEVRPRLFWQPSATASLTTTVGLTAESRTGGGSSWANRARTTRGDVGAIGTIAFGAGHVLAMRASASVESGTRVFGTASGVERRSSAFSELSLTNNVATHTIVTGLAFSLDSLAPFGGKANAYSYKTPAAFVQETWLPVERFAGSLALRLDDHSRYGLLFSQRLSVLFRLPTEWILRGSLGNGSFAPTSFIDATQELTLTEILPSHGLFAERAVNAKVDLDAKIGPIDLDVIGHATRIRNAVGIDSAAVFLVALANASQPTRIAGGAVVTRYSRGRLQLIGQVDLTNASELNVWTNARQRLPYTPTNCEQVTAAFEGAGHTRVSATARRVGEQMLDRDPYRLVSKPYIELSVSLSKRVGRHSIFFSGEDLGDVRQSRYTPLEMRAPTSPPNYDARLGIVPWAPLAGRSVTVGVRL